MLHCQKKTGIVGLILVTIIMTSAHGKQYEGWEIKSTSADGSVIMTLTDTKAVVTHDVEMEIDGSGKCKSVILKFQSGFEKKGSEGELRYYWIERKGIVAWWQNMNERTRLNILIPDPKEPVPGEWFGSIVHCVIADGRNFIGRLRGTNGNGQWIALEIEGALDPVKFYLGAIKEMRTLKRF